jgi:HK97 family phage major capsid protein
MPVYNSIISRTDAAGTIPVEYSNELINMVATESSHVMRLGRRLQNMSRYQNTLPIVSALPVAYFVTGDTSLKQTTEMNWEDKVVTAEELAVIVPISEAVLDDMNIDVWAEIRPHIVEALGLAIDNAVLYGTNKPSSWPNAIITDAATASHNLSIAASTDLYEAILGDGKLFSLVEQDGYMVTGSIAHLSMKGKLRDVRTTDGMPIFNTDPAASGSYILDGTPIFFPTNGAGSATYLMISGMWNQLVYSIRQDITFKVLDQAVIQDGSGTIVYNLAQQDMIALRVVIRLGFQLPNPINRVNETAATRYPFAYLTA